MNTKLLLTNEIPAIVSKPIRIAWKRNEKGTAPHSWLFLSATRNNRGLMIVISPKQCPFYSTKVRWVSLVAEKISSCFYVRNSKPSSNRCDRCNLNHFQCFLILPPFKAVKLFSFSTRITGLTVISQPVFGNLLLDNKPNQTQVKKLCFVVSSYITKKYNQYDSASRKLGKMCPFCFSSQGTGKHFKVQTR